MKPAIPAINIDVAIVGGGIAGLWLLARLREQGYGAVLIESDRLGSGQTICAQGIIHGGAKYSLHGQLSASAQAIAGMPALWRRCLSGAGEIDLREAQLLAEHQYLWATCAPTSRLTAFFASKLMRSRMEKVADDLPVALQHPEFRGATYRLDEPIVGVSSVLTAFANRYRDALLFSSEPIRPAADGHLTLHHPDRPPLTLAPACIVFTAGSGNVGLSWAEQQLRPLHMVMARGANLPGPLYAHCLGVSDTPRLTITSHSDAKGRLNWYLGGGLVILMIIFAILYIAGINIFICLIIIFSAGTALFMYVYKMSRTYGQYGLMKKIAKKAVPKVIKSYSIVKLKKLLVK